MRRPFLFALGALCALGAGLTALPAAAGRDRPPNIVLILADDLGWGDLGCYGQKKIRTPHLDRLAADGVRFTSAYSGAPVCAPSRCMLLTGRHSGHAAVRNNREVQPEGQHPLPADATTLPRLLKNEGYATAAIGKWGLGPPGSSGDPSRHGFDLFFGYNCQRHAHNHYPTYLRRNAQRLELPGNDGGAVGRQFSHDLMDAEALRFVDAHRDRPFFLYLPFAIPHLALQAPEDSLAEYRGQWEDPPYAGGRGYLPHATPRAAYAAMITRMDRTVGRLRERLETHGLTRDTLILFSSDNGPAPQDLGGSDSAFFRSAGGFRGLKGSVYEGGLRVPLLAAWPGRIPAGRSSAVQVYFPDLLPTLCEAAGAPVPLEIDGISFLPTLLGRPGQRRHDFLYWEFPAYGGQQAVRFGRWKAVRQNLLRGPVRTELYDLRIDPAEQHDLAAARPAELAHAERLMREQRRPSRDFPFPALDAAARSFAAAR